MARKCTTHRDKQKSLTAQVEHATETMSTAQGCVALARDGNREALKAWAAVVAAYLEQLAAADANPLEHGFPFGFDEGDARACLRATAEAMQALHRGEQPDRVFGWKRAGRGRPSTVSANFTRALEDDSRLADIDRLRVNFNYTIRQACEEVAEHWKDSADRLENLYHRN